jgi:acyl carrier protein
MDSLETQIVKLLHGILGPEASAGIVNANSPLLGVVAELDSMAVVAILTAIEERFGIAIADDDVDGATFQSVGSLVSFVRDQQAA